MDNRHSAESASRRAGTLMLLGIGLFGILTASLSSLFVAQSQESQVARLQEEIRSLRAQVAAIGTRLDAGNRATPPPAPSHGP